MSDLHKQLPHYVLAKNTRSGSDIDSSSSSSSGKVNHSDDLFDPLYESDEIDDAEYSSSDYRQEIMLQFVCWTQ